MKKQEFTRKEVIGVIEEILQYPDILIDAVQNENTDFNAEELLELAEKQAKEMKTEPTEALVLKKSIQYGLGVIDAGSGVLSEVSFMVDNVVDIAFKEGQSSPKIKQLEWKEIDKDGGNGIKATTPFGDYEIYEKYDQTGYILWWFDTIPYVFNAQAEAKKFAEDDFEKRGRDCLINE